jgi:hypothetical protein
MAVAETRELLPTEADSNGLSVLVLHTLEIPRCHVSNLGGRTKLNIGYLGAFVVCTLLPLVQFVYAKRQFLRLSWLAEGFASYVRRCWVYRSI